MGGWSFEANLPAFAGVCAAPAIHVIGLPCTLTLKVQISHFGRKRSRALGYPVLPDERLDHVRLWVAPLVTLDGDARASPGDFPSLRWHDAMKKFRSSSSTS